MHSNKFFNPDRTFFAFFSDSAIDDSDRTILCGAEQRVVPNVVLHHGGGGGVQFYAEQSSE